MRCNQRVLILIWALTIVIALIFVFKIIKLCDKTFDRFAYLCYNCINLIILILNKFVGGIS